MLPALKKVHDASFGYANEAAIHARHGADGRRDGRNRSAVRHGCFAVGAYITAAYWFTASASFANPAVTIARALTDTFAGIRPADVPGFIVGQAIGATAATALFRWLVPHLPETADRVVVPKESEYAHRDY